MSEKESQVGTCVECSVKEGDSSEKKVRQCELCGRWFCEKHREPRLVYIKDFESIDDSRETRALFIEIEQYQDGHPDFPYTRRRVVGLGIEEQKQNELIRKAFDRMNHYYDDVPDAKTDRIKRVVILEKEEEEIDKPKPQVPPDLSGRDSSRAEWSIVSLLVLLAGLGLFLYGFTDVHLTLNVAYYASPIPFWTIGLGLVLFGSLGLLASFRK
jgi:hypothetical protein